MIKFQIEIFIYIYTPVYVSLMSEPEVAVVRKNLERN